MSQTVKDLRAMRQHHVDRIREIDDALMFIELATFKPPVADIPRPAVAQPVQERPAFEFVADDGRVVYPPIEIVAADDGPATEEQKAEYAKNTEALVADIRESVTQQPPEPAPETPPGAEPVTEEPEPDYIALAEDPYEELQPALEANNARVDAMEDEPSDFERLCAEVDDEPIPETWPVRRQEKAGPSLAVPLENMLETQARNEAEKFKPTEYQDLPPQEPKLDGLNDVQKDVVNRYMAGETISGIMEAVPTTYFICKKALEKAGVKVDPRRRTLK